MPKRPVSSDTDSEHPVQKVKKTDMLELVKQYRLQYGKSILDCKFNKKRVRMLTDVDEFPQDANGGVLYWMVRDQRLQDNWAMLFAQRLALKEKTSLHVCFCLVSPFLEATERHYDFVIRGLQEVEKDCQKLDINFHLLQGNPTEEVSKFVKDKNIAAIVTDFNPLRIPRQWVDDLLPKLPKSVGLCQVDTHNIVPCWITSPKQEYGARTIRSKIHSQLCNFLTDFPPVIVHPYKAKEIVVPVDWMVAKKKLKMDTSVKPVDWAIPGERAGLKTLEIFCNERLKYFATERNDPTKASLSNLSPWLHFGQVSAQRCVLMIKKLGKAHKASVDAFIEEAVIRSELADNFCYYQENYDKLEGAYDWAKKSLKEHEKDKREYIYTKEQFENAKTHDQLWNAAQIQLLTEGKMHGFLRMYWAKKILEWTANPAEGLRVAIFLNDRYSLDGMDSNGYVGCMWSCCGMHDRAWGERNIIGKIRIMTFAGCKKKFDVDGFIQKYSKREN